MCVYDARARCDVETENLMCAVAAAAEAATTTSSDLWMPRDAVSTRVTGRWSAPKLPACLFMCFVILLRPIHIASSHARTSIDIYTNSAGLSKRVMSLHV